MKPQPLSEAFLVREALALKAEHERLREALEIIRTFEAIDNTYTSAKSGSIPDEMLRRFYRLTQSVRDRLGDVKSLLLDPTDWLDLWADIGEANALKFAAGGAPPPPFHRSRSRRPVSMPRTKAVKIIEKALAKMDARLLVDLRDYAPPED